ncbi:thioredoxin-like domain-containing protein [Mariniflexile gromovii]|uniref:TlpA family protein disulfide reductase n=1 Tax=Mariniflexile gromovii TaxID=362523 RepID=A0ABS4BRK4_9FLAO|nr:thioredoxin-like domain-containing protein [Mariniflexile gromovii]MBP0903212.1 TlpA family protein disulfide reductase [Mariniflexile gromovii]
MKKYQLILLMAFICSYAFAQKTIKNPEHSFSSFPGKITSVELIDTATVVHFHIKMTKGSKFSIPKKTYIQDLSGEEKLFVTKADGIKLNKWEVMPDTGGIFYHLFFPKLDKKATVIDYGEANEGGSWGIYGIQLVENDSETKVDFIPENIKKWLDSELTKTKKQPIKDYNSDTFFNRNSGRLVGYIKHYSPRFGFKTGIIYTGNDITREDYPVVVPIDENGRFEVEVPMLSPKFSYLSFNKKVIKFYLEPEQTLGIVVGSDVEYLGGLAKINEDLVGFESGKYDYKKFREKLKEQSPETFKEEETLQYKNNLETLSTYFENNTITEKAKVLLKNEISLEYANHLFDFVMSRTYEARRDSINEVLKIPVKDEYYDFLQEMDLNDKSLLVLERFSTFVNRFEFSDPINIYPKIKPSSFKPEKTFLEYLDEEKIDISDSEKELIKNYETKKIKSAEVYMKYMEALSEHRKSDLKAYSDKYIKPHYETISKKEMSKEIAMEKWQLRDSVVKNTYHLDKNLVYDLVKIRALDFDIKRSDSENAHAYWETLKKDIDHSFLKEEGERMVNKAFPIQSIKQNGLEDNTKKMVNMDVATTTTKLPLGKATDVFKGIIDSHKGKILFVDFWATSCAPCVGGIKRMNGTRKKYENNPDFDFVFITDERSSPLKTYNDFVEEQDLKNIYRLSLDDYNYLRQLFKFNGIPRYVVLDKKGDVINENFPMHNFDYLLDGILEKYK